MGDQASKTLSDSPITLCDLLKKNLLFYLRKLNFILCYGLWDAQLLSLKLDKSKAHGSALERTLIFFLKSVNFSRSPYTSHPGKCCVAWGFIIDVFYSSTQGRFMLKWQPSKAKARCLGCGVGDSVGGTLPSPSTLNKCPCVVTGMGYVLADTEKKATRSLLSLWDLHTEKLASGSLQVKENVNPLKIKAVSVVLQ